MSFKPAAVALLILFIVCTAFAEESGVAVYREARLDWGPGLRNGLVTALAADAVFPRPPYTSDALERGDVRFIEGQVPFEFVGWIRADGQDLVLYAGGDSPTILDKMTPIVWVGGGSPVDGVVEQEFIGAELSLGGSTAWDAAIRAKRKVVLKKDEVFTFRCVMKLTDEGRKMLVDRFGGDEARMSLALLCKVHEIAGNEALAAELNRVQRGRPKGVVFPTNAFRVLDEEDVDRETLFGMYRWRLRRMMQDVDKASTVYKSMLELEPGNELVRLEFARYLSSNDRFDEAASVVVQLATLVGKPPLNGRRLTNVSSYGLHSELEGRRTMPREEIVEVLKQHVERLRARAK